MICGLTGSSDVVDGDVADQPRVARLRVHLDDGGVRARGPGEVRRVEHRRLLEARLHTVGEVVRRVRRERRRLDRHRAIGRALHRECSVRELEVVLRHLELMRDDRARLRHDLLAGVMERDPADRERAAAVGVHAELRDGSVAVQHLDVVDADAELVGDDLRKRRLVALAVRRGARDDLHRAERLEADRRRVPAADRVADGTEDARRREAAHLVVGREADADLLHVAARPSRLPARLGYASRSSSSSSLSSVAS